MKKLLYTGLALLVFGCLAMPASAQGQAHGKSAVHSKASTHSQASARSNKGGQVRGLQRAAEVQSMNGRADAKRGFTVAPGVEKAEGETATKTTHKTTAKGKSATHRTSTGEDADESKD
jgi:hypothetical protein